MSTGAPQVPASKTTTAAVTGAANSAAHAPVDSASATNHGHGHGHQSIAALAVASIGVVYGDIGTSPLYAFREALHAAVGHDGVPAREAVLGILSLILWALIIIVTLKYVLLLLRADNNGEGGTLALMALVMRHVKGLSFPVMLLGVLGAAMFYGDSFITPAISVLSAVEGLEFIAPALHPFVLPVTLVILTALFAVQSRGTAKVAAFFGPVMVLWFITIAGLGLYHISDDPGVMAAVNPAQGLAFLAQHWGIGLVTLGAVFLAVTGGEALYADLGHFGRVPIQVAWLGFVLPCLVINYFGQGAMVLADPTAMENPFYRMAPDALIVPLVVLATCATVIASQAVITGAFSLTRQAIQLGLLPRFEIRHTSESQSGQIYIPRLNLILLIGVIALVLSFRSSSGLASAYGVAVATTMVVAALLLFIVAWKRWHWHPLVAFAVIAPFIVIDGLFLAANLMKLFEGAYVPLLIAAAIMVIVATWTRGAQVLAKKTRRIEVPLETLIHSLEKRPPHQVPGTAVFLTGDQAYAPTALLHNLKHNKVIHDTNVVLTIRSTTMPRVKDEMRVSVHRVSERFVTMTATYGFAETPNVPRALQLARESGIPYDIMSTSFFLSRRTLKPSRSSDLPGWQRRLFIALAHNAANATDFFRIPSGRVVEVGTQVDI
jgi:KUP system potassium uptake protein